MNETQKRLIRDELFDLHKYYGAAIQAELDLFYKYFNFYVGLLSAILALTFAGLTGIEKPAGQISFLSLLIGPVLIIVLSYVGYSYVHVFYRRFTEAWVAAVNIEEMLQLHDPEIVEPGVHQPLYPSEDGGGFIPAFASKKIRKIFKTAKEESWTAERLVDVHVDEGVTQGKARSTFIMFDVAGVVLAIIIILIFFGY